MSRFSTTIPIAVEEVVKSLPPGAVLNAIRMGDGQKTVVIEWECDTWRTPHTFPIDVPPDALTAKAPLSDKIITPAEFKRVPNQDVAPAATRKAKKTQ